MAKHPPLPSSEPPVPATGSGPLGRLRSAVRRERIVRTPDERLWVRTADNWQLRTLYYRPAADVAPLAEPVILSHGLCMNSYSFDLLPPWSLARHLASRGFHVFVPDLRGRRRSRPVRGYGQRLHDYSFDHHALADAPALLDTALERTRARRAFWVGHSLGGLMGYVLAAFRPEEVAGLVALASPLVLAPDRLFASLARLAAAYPFDPVPQRFFATALSPVAGAFPFLRQVSSLLVDMDPVLLHRALGQLVEDLPRRITRQMVHWSRTGRFCSEDGKVDYRALLPSVRAPLLAMAACQDRLAPPDTVRPAFDEAGSADRTWLCLGRDLGNPGQTYGHGDVVLGRDAPTVVFPVVARWLQAHAGAERRSAPAPAPRAGAGAGLDDTQRTAS